MRLPLFYGRQQQPYINQTITGRAYDKAAAKYVVRSSSNADDFINIFRKESHKCFLNPDNPNIVMLWDHFPKSWITKVVLLVASITFLLIVCTYAAQWWAKEIKIVDTTR